MKKAIYTGIFCTILGLCINTPANASIISRNFLDQALTDYATTTALDLKANQSDLTDLSSKIGTLPRGSLLGNSPAMDALFISTQGTDTPVFPNSLSDLINQLYGSAISALLHGFDFNFGEYNGPVGVLPAMELGLSATQAAKAASTTATEAKTAADANTAKIGTLPEGITVQSMYEGWTDSERNFYPGLNILSKNDRLLQNAYKTDSPSLLIGGAESTTIDGVDYTGPVYPLWKLSEGIDRIGTLPRGGLPEGNTAMYDLFKFTQDTDTPVYPVSLSDLINQLYGNTEGDPGAIAYLLKGFKYNEFKFSDEYDGNVGVLPAMELGISANTAATTAQETANRAKALAESNATAIGTLPDGYETVGAALSAIKGIAEEAKAAALAAIPDPKTEGSNGKYVLTVDIIGDNATYRWEQIDRGNTTTTTE